ncbi:MAG: ABC transporter ATP-binding protein [Candidatus Thermoplasmatota archaeon]
MVRVHFHGAGRTAAGGGRLKALEVKGLSFSYEDGTPALKAVDLDVDEGEKVAVVGPNGAGKSTLLHLVAGFRFPFQGSVKVMGDPLEERTADGVRRHIGLLFQDPDDQIFMPTVEEDVAFGPVNLGMDSVGDRVLRALRSVSAEGLAKRRPHRLSHGMKKRVAIAGVLAMEPGVLLLDEPTAGLDPRSRSGLIGILKGMRRTMLIATHDLEAAGEVADRVVLLNGSVVFDGPLSELVARDDVLDAAGLEPPQVSRLFRRLGAMGYGTVGVPVTLDQGAAEAVRMIERERAKARGGGR